MARRAKSAGQVWLAAAAEAGRRGKARVVALGLGGIAAAIGQAWCIARLLAPALGGRRRGARAMGDRDRPARHAPGRARLRDRAAGVRGWSGRAAPDSHWPVRRIVRARAGGDRRPVAGRARRARDRRHGGAGRVFRPLAARGGAGGGRAGAGRARGPRGRPLGGAGAGAGRAVRAGRHGAGRARRRGRVAGAVRGHGTAAGALPGPRARHRHDRAGRAGGGRGGAARGRRRGAVAADACGSCGSPSSPRRRWTRRRSRRWSCSRSGSPARSALGALADPALGLFPLLLVVEFFAPLRAFAAAYQDRMHAAEAAEQLAATVPPTRRARASRGADSGGARRHRRVRGRVPDPRPGARPGAGRAQLPRASGRDGDPARPLGRGQDDGDRAAARLPAAGRGADHAQRRRAREHHAAGALAHDRVDRAAPGAVRRHAPRQHPLRPRRTRPTRRSRRRRGPPGWARCCRPCPTGWTR